MGLLVKLAGADRRIRNHISTRRASFTLVELLVVVGIISIFTTIAYFSMSKLQTSTESKTSVDRVVAALRAQRMFAMLGNSALRTQAMPQGIHFDQGNNTYTQFSCSQITDCVYDPNNKSNTQNMLAETLSFSDVNLTDNQVVFIPLSGDVSDYSQSENSITISSSAETTKTKILITEMGAIFTTKP